MLRARALTPMWLGWILSPGLYMALFGAPAGERNEGVWSTRVICSSWQARLRLAVECDAAKGRENGGGLQSCLGEGPPVH